MRNIRTEGIIIKRRNFKEADRILTVMTRDFGKIHVKAAGVRKITSRRSAHIELLNHAALHLYKSNNFLVLTEVKMLDDFADIKKDIDKIGFAYHLCELIDGLCPEDQDNSNVFTLLKRTLHKLTHQESLFAIPTKQSEIEDFTLGTYGVGLNDALPVARPKTMKSHILDQFERALLAELGYWNKYDAVSQHFDTHAMIETILERKLKSRNIFSKLQ